MVIKRKVLHTFNLSNVQKRIFFVDDDGANNIALLYQITLLESFGDSGNFMLVSNIERKKYSKNDVIIQGLPSQKSNP